MSSRALFVAVWCSVLAGRSVDGQSLRGRVVLLDSVTPAPGIVVTATAEGAKAGISTLTLPSGYFLLRLPSRGRYDLRVLRIGFRATVIRGIDVSADSVQLGNIVLDPLPVPLTEMVVRDRADCDFERGDGDTFVQLWEQARAALVAAQLGGQPGTLDVHLIRIEGKVDAMKWHAPRLIGIPVAEMDSANAREWISDRALTAALPETLAARGYVRRRPNGGIVYEAPTADALLSDAFLVDHCFNVVKPPRGHSDWIGIGFVPRAIRDSVVDVAGVLWLDRASAELRRLEFEYRNMPRDVHVLCEGDPIMNSPDRFNRICHDYIETDARSFGMGGDADFRRLPGGEWATVRWTLRMVSNEWNLRPTGKKVRHLSPRERCTSRAVSEALKRPGDCVNVWTPVPRLTVVSTAVVRLVRNGAEVYHDDASLAAIAAAAKKKGGKHPAHLAGTILDQSGQGLRNAIVQIEKPSRVALTDSFGAFRIETLPAQTLTVSVRCRGYRPIRFTLPLLPDSTRRVSAPLTPDTSSTRRSTDCSGSQ